MKNHKKLIEEEIQQAVENHSAGKGHDKTQSLNEDIALYETVFESLAEEPTFSIDDDFAKDTLKIAQKRRKVKDIRWKISLYIMVSVPLIMLSLLVTFAMGPEMFWNMLETSKNNVIYFIFALMLFSIIQILDRRLIRSRL